MKARTFIRILVALWLVGAMADVSASYDYRDAPKKRRKPPAPRPSQTELDPLRAIKIFTDPGVGVGPNVVIAMDTSVRMMYDFTGAYYDPMLWDKQASWSKSSGDNDPNVVASDLGVSSAARFYRRIYRGLSRGADGTYTATSIEAVDETETDFVDFFALSRLGMVRDGLGQAVEENMLRVRVGLVRMRIGNGPVWPGGDSGSQKPVVLTAIGQQDLAGDVNTKEWRINYPITNGYNIDQTDATGWTAVAAQAQDSSASTLQYLRRNPDESHSIHPFGQDAGSFQDSPLANLLIDSKREVEKLTDDDLNTCRACRNTAVLLVTGGGDGGKGKGKPTDPVAVAAQFSAITTKGVTRRIPIYVLAIAPPAGDVSELQGIAAVSGGQYFEVYHPNEIAWAANHVMQSVHRYAADFDAGRPSEFQTVSPVVGTVNLRNATDVHGATLPNTVLSLTQNSNVLVTGGFTLPGFAASLRAFRTFKPVADATQKTGYKFVKDGTPLWVARMPGSPKTLNVRGDPTVRNIYTYVPGSGMLAFTSANAALLRPHLQAPTDLEAEDLIAFVRDQPVGAIISSTPAFMNPPTLDPPPDSDYTIFAQARANRRTILFVGANDGMLHGLDGRTGVEVWAFIPFNMLPKLQTLVDNQPVHNFEYMMDSSPKVADVKVNGVWRTILMVGEGAGGTFYQTFDMSDAGMAIPAESDGEATVVGAFAASNVIPLLWSFPDYNAFDPSLSTDHTPYGDLAAGASAIEKTVGETWSAPAVGQVGDATGKYAAIVGSGYLSVGIEGQSARGGATAGAALYVLDIGTGQVLSSYDAGDDPSRENLKHAFQADPAALGPSNTRFIDTIYIGDTEGYLWRFNVNKDGLLSNASKIYDAKTEHPIYSSPAVVNISGNNYLFVSTGIDTLPTPKKIDNFVMVGLLDTGGAAAQQTFEIKLETANDLKGDERPTSSLVVAGDIVFLTTTTEFPDLPCDQVLTRLYALTFTGAPAYDSNGDNRLNSSDSAMIRQVKGRGTATFVSDQHLYFGAGASVEILGDPDDFNNGVGQIAARLLSWRELR